MIKSLEPYRGHFRVFWEANSVAGTDLEAQSRQLEVRFSQQGAQVRPGKA